MTAMKTEQVWIVTTDDLGGNTGTVIQGVFASEEACQAWIDAAWSAIEDESWLKSGEWWGARTKDNTYEVEVHDLDPTPDKHGYWVFIAEVYPDKRLVEQKNRHESMRSVVAVDDDALTPWDGHTQGHCGYHVYIRGGDHERVERVYGDMVAWALERCNGTCPFCGATEKYQYDFWNGPQRHGRVEQTEPREWQGTRWSLETRGPRPWTPEEIGVKT